MKVFLCGGGAGIVALEEVTLFVNDDCIEVIGDRPYYFFENGVMIQGNENIFKV